MNFKVNEVCKTINSASVRYSPLLFMITVWWRNIGNTAGWTLFSNNTHRALRTLQHRNDRIERSEKVLLNTYKAMKHHTPLTNENYFMRAMHLFQFLRLALRICFSSYELRHAFVSVPVNCVTHLFQFVWIAPRIFFQLLWIASRICFSSYELRHAFVSVPMNCVTHLFQFLWIASRISVRMNCATHFFQFVWIAPRICFSSCELRRAFVSVRMNCATHFFQFLWIASRICFSSY
jgi:hypothetical protein